ncbi:hypothetical protein [Saccharicrinis fermentans]|uniref:Uncharacterized protein n=1 Tax=Saccharicrinis fermentans DSM 9555 = JCM 21142 TaxID=869213 RepID=W7YDM9_9BACT|nr:hypothetical protein [Saccharicrinis fermentans]GAF05568.1 hypothetical protein JCM21142_104308 [Saccharicrinis fermentans DSM 9555 = JCM 21142]
MRIELPYHRIYRPVIESHPNAGYSSWAYIVDRNYCQSGHSYVRAFLLILEDLKRIFEFIEPSPESMQTFSYRIHELFMRTCIEVEANFKAILSENIYTPQLDRFGNPILNMRIYRKVNSTHRLSSYKVGLPQWSDSELLILEPFKVWSESNTSPEWYQSYNKSKHDRHDNFKYANLENLLNAISGLLVLISSQFRQEDFSAGESLMAFSGGDYYDMQSAIGSLFRIQFPTNWSDEEKYHFDWSELKNEEIRFQKFNYDEL